MRTSIYILLFFLLSLSISGCDKFVEVELPESQLTGEAVFQTENTADAAMAGLLGQLRDDGMLSGSLFGLSYLLGIYADEFDIAAALSDNEFYTNNILAEGLAVANHWNKTYNFIFSANSIYERAIASPSLPVQAKDRLKGEALLIRGLLHFYLLNLYGPIPYIATTDYVANSQATRMPVSTVYERIVADLLEAQSLLADTYYSAERARPNRFTATALLARVYLYMGQWQLAHDAATAIIESNQYVWEDDLSKTFLNDCRATIWQLAAITGANTTEADLFIATAAPPSQLSLTPGLVAAFGTGDLRKMQWTDTVCNSTDTFYFPFKYKQRLPSSPSVEYSIVMRLSEQYLIRAEANARLGAFAEAQADLNKIRNTAGLDDTPADNEALLVNAILEERRLELFSERGHRFFDLKRLGRLDEFLGAVKPGWVSTDQYWPLPEVELTVNPKLAPQNDGY